MKRQSFLEKSFLSSSPLICRDDFARVNHSDFPNELSGCLGIWGQARIPNDLCLVRVTLRLTIVRNETIVWIAEVERFHLKLLFVGYTSNVTGSEMTVKLFCKLFCFFLLSSKVPLDPTLSQTGYAVCSRWFSSFGLGGCALANNQMLTPSKPFRYHARNHTLVTSTREPSTKE